MENIARTVFIVNKLLEAPYTVSQLKFQLSEELKTAKPVNDSQIYKYLEELKKLGFMVTKSKRTKKSASAYRVESTPFRLTLKEEEKEFIRDLFASYPNQQGTMTGFFETLNNYLNFDLENIIGKEGTIDYENQEIYLKTKKVLERAKQQKKKVSFKYLPVGKEIKPFSGFPYRLEKDEKKTERVILYNDYFGNYSECN